VKYEYDGIGNLVYVHKLVDRQAKTYATTTYQYDPKSANPHYITKILDARNVQVAMNRYYDNGKLWQITDAENRTTTFTYPAVSWTAPRRDC